MSRSIRNSLMCSSEGLVWCRSSGLHGATYRRCTLHIHSFVHLHSRTLLPTRLQLITPCLRDNNMRYNPGFSLDLSTTASRHSRSTSSFSLSSVDSHSDSEEESIASSATSVYTISEKECEAKEEARSTFSSDSSEEEEEEDSDECLTPVETPMFAPLPTPFVPVSVTISEVTQLIARVDCCHDKTKHTSAYFARSSTYHVSQTRSHSLTQTASTHILLPHYYFDFDLL